MNNIEKLQQEFDKIKSQREILEQETILKEAIEKEKEKISELKPNLLKRLGLGVN